MEENNTEKTEEKSKKNAVWSKFRDDATVKMPDGSEHTFDFSKLSNEVFAYYGKKQWLADKVASTEAEDKLQGMIDNYNEAVEKGVTLSENGKISIIGKERSNASGIKVELKEAKNLNALLMKKMKGEELSEADEAWIQEMMAKY